MVCHSFQNYALAMVIISTRLIANRVGPKINQLGSEENRLNFKLEPTRF